MPRANQQMIADRLGLSRATVSRCFTNHAGINAQTRAKVFQLAAEIGYTHSETRSPAARKSKPDLSFEVLICSDPEEYLHGPYQSPGEQLLEGVSEFAQIHSIKLTVNFIPPSASSVDHPSFEKIPGLRSRKNRGILLIYPFPRAITQELSLKFPLVSLVDQRELDTIDCVDVDHATGINRLTNHLTQLGHQRIGFYTRDYEIEASWSFRRYSAFIEKMARRHSHIPQADIIGIFPNTFPSVEKSIEAAIAQTEKGVTAWICAADHQAYDLIDAFEKRGFSVPHDVSITGYDGIPQPDSSKLLTTMQIPFRAIGMTGAERLAGRIRKPFDGKQHIYISGKLQEGQTVAPPPFRQPS